jgi:predicted DNA-binding transcriptional regulator AlpA
MTDQLAQAIAEAIRPELSKIKEELLAALAAQTAPQADVIRPEQLREMLGISPATEWAWRNQGRLPYTRINRLVYYRLADVLAALDEQKERPGGLQCHPAKNEISAIKPLQKYAKNAKQTGK